MSKNRSGTEPATKHISQRDFLKLAVGAAGAVVLSGIDLRYLFAGDDFSEREYIELHEKLGLEPPQMVFGTKKLKSGNLVSEMNRGKISVVRETKSIKHDYVNIASRAGGIETEKYSRKYWSDGMIFTSSPDFEGKPYMSMLIPLKIYESPDSTGGIMLMAFVRSSREKQSLQALNEPTVDLQLPRKIVEEERGDAMLLAVTFGEFATTHNLLGVNMPVKSLVLAPHQHESHIRMSLLRYPKQALVETYRSAGSFIDPIKRYLTNSGVKNLGGEMECLYLPDMGSTFSPNLHGFRTVWHDENGLPDAEQIHKNFTHPAMLAHFQGLTEGVSFVVERV